MPDSQCQRCNRNFFDEERLILSKERWGQYLMMNKENQRVETEERHPNQAMTRNIIEEETERALRGVKCGKAVGADEIPAEAWKCMCNTYWRENLDWITGRIERTISEYYISRLRRRDKYYFWHLYHS